MPELHLLRHAKSSWDDLVERDFDRPLNARGRRAAVAIGRAMAGAGPLPGRVLASPAARVRETLDGVEEGLGRSLGARFEPRIYLASSMTLAEVVEESPDEVLMIVGHNPGLEELCLALTEGDAGGPRAAVAEKYPTAAWATLALPGEGWAGLMERRGRLLRFVRPRDLDPTLGPDA